MSLAHRFFVAAFLFLFLVPSYSLAATASSSTGSQQSSQQLIAQLQAELSALQAQLNSVRTSSSTSTTTAPIIISQQPSALVAVLLGNHIDEANGGLRITFSNIAHFNVTGSVASTSPLLQPIGVFLLDYSECSSTFCPDPAYPTMTTKLQPGQSTSYLNYRIQLNSISGSTALLTVIPA